MQSKSNIMLLPPYIRLLRLQPLNLHLLHLPLPSYFIRNHQTIRRHKLRHLSYAFSDVASPVREVVELRLKRGDRIVGLSFIGCHGEGLGNV